VSNLCALVAERLSAAATDGAGLRIWVREADQVPSPPPLDTLLHGTPNTVKNLASLAG
jgi:hypothetical protein